MMNTRPTPLPEPALPERDIGIDPEVMAAAKRHAVHLRAMAISDAIDSTARGAAALLHALRARLSSAVVRGPVALGPFARR